MVKSPGHSQEPDVVCGQTCITLDAFLQQQRLEARRVGHPLTWIERLAH